MGDEGAQRVEALMQRRVKAQGQLMGRRVDMGMRVAICCHLGGWHAMNTGLHGHLESEVGRRAMARAAAGAAGGADQARPRVAGGSVAGHAAGSAAEGREVKCGLSRRHAVLLPLGSRRSHAAITWVQLRPADFMGSVAPDAFPCHRISGRTPNAKFRSAQPASLQAGQKATDDREEASRDRPAPVVAGDSVRHGSGGLHWLGRLLARRRLLPRFIQRDQ